MRHTPLLAALLAAACAACREAPAHELTRAAMEHGVVPGTRLAATPVRCLHGPPREVGARGKRQIVTFATPFDCSRCTPHMSNVPRVLREMKLDSLAFVVVWSPKPRGVEQEMGRARSELPVCVNDDGSLWDRYDVLHTPFTVVLEDGRVVYSNDATFLHPKAEQDFRADLAALFRQPR
jgi:hypothetical protein